VTEFNGTFTIAPNPDRHLGRRQCREHSNPIITWSLTDPDGVKSTKLVVPGLAVRIILQERAFIERQVLGQSLRTFVTGPDSANWPACLSADGFPTRNLPLYNLRHGRTWNHNAYSDTFTLS